MSHTLCSLDAGRRFGRRKYSRPAAARDTPAPLHRVKRSPRLSAVARGIALFIGAFTLLNLAGEIRTSGFDANIWWIDLRPLPQLAARLALLLLSVSLAGYVARPAMGPARRRLTLAIVATAVGVTIANAIGFYSLVAAGTIDSAFPLSLSLLVAGALAVVLVAVARNVEPETGFRYWRRLTLTLLLCSLLFPLAQMLCFGETDYRRPADVAVVFGARVYADGGLSTAVADRVATGCELYRAGLVRSLIFSGGPGDGAIHETEAMRRRAIELGVRPEDIIVDTLGINTHATVRNTAGMLADGRHGRAIAVSHFYHLPRVKMTYQRSGVEVYTVPARESYVLGAMPWYLAREIAALWAYYLSALWNGRVEGEG